MIRFLLTLFTALNKNDRDKFIRMLPNYALADRFMLPMPLDYVSPHLSKKDYDKLVAGIMLAVTKLFQDPQLQLDAVKFNIDPSLAINLPSGMGDVPPPGSAISMSNVWQGGRDLERYDHDDVVLTVTDRLLHGDVTTEDMEKSMIALIESAVSAYGLMTNSEVQNVVDSAIQPIYDYLNSVDPLIQKVEGVHNMIDQFKADLEQLSDYVASLPTSQDTEKVLDEIDKVWEEIDQIPRTPKELRQNTRKVRRGKRADRRAARKERRLERRAKVSQESGSSIAASLPFPGSSSSSTTGQSVLSFFGDVTDASTAFEGEPSGFLTSISSVMSGWGSALFGNLIDPLSNRLMQTVDKIGDYTGLWTNADRDKMNKDLERQKRQWEASLKYSDKGQLWQANFKLALNSQLVLAKKKYFYNRIYAFQRQLMQEFAKKAGVNRQVKDTHMRIAEFNLAEGAHVFLGFTPAQAKNITAYAPDSYKKFVADRFREWVSFSTTSLPEVVAGIASLVTKASLSYDDIEPFLLKGDSLSIAIAKAEKAVRSAGRDDVTQLSPSAESEVYTPEVIVTPEPIESSVIEDLVPVSDSEGLNLFVTPTQVYSQTKMGTLSPIIDAGGQYLNAFTEANLTYPFLPQKTYGDVLEGLPFFAAPLLTAGAKGLLKLFKGKSKKKLKAALKEAENVINQLTNENTLLRQQVMEMANRPQLAPSPYLPSTMQPTGQLLTLPQGPADATTATERLPAGTVRPPGYGDVLEGGLMDIVKKGLKIVKGIKDSGIFRKKSRDKHPDDEISSHRSSEDHLITQSIMNEMKILLRQEVTIPILNAMRDYKGGFRDEAVFQQEYMTPRFSEITSGLQTLIPVRFADTGETTYIPPQEAQSGYYMGRRIINI
jgi:uncharacterized protein YoxC